jgi:hypothetical protein
MGFYTPRVDQGALAWSFALVTSIESHHLAGVYHIACGTRLGRMVMVDSCRIYPDIHLARTATASYHIRLVHIDLPSHDWVGSFEVGGACLAYPCRTVCHPRNIRLGCGLICNQVMSIHLVRRKVGAPFHFYPLLTTGYGMDVLTFDSSRCSCWLSYPIDRQSHSTNKWHPPYHRNLSSTRNCSPQAFDVHLGDMQ